MRELQIGEVIIGRSRIWRASRIRAVLALALGIAFSFGLARTGTTVTHTGPTSNQCGTVKQPVRGAAGGSGTVHIGS